MGDGVSEMEQQMAFGSRLPISTGAHAQAYRVDDEELCDAHRPQRYTPHPNRYTTKSDQRFAAQSHDQNDGHRNREQIEHRASHSGPSDRHPQKEDIHYLTKRTDESVCMRRCLDHGKGNSVQLQDQPDLPPVQPMLRLSAASFLSVSGGSAHTKQ